jgi:hypothetical protein
MNENYMDYGNIQCEERFTTHQKTRMRLALYDDLTGELGPRGSLLYSGGCCENPLVAAIKRKE